MLNKIVIVGRLTKKAQIFENEEVKIATFCVATERNYKDENNEIACDYIFVRHLVKATTNIESYTDQGTLVGITGQMRSRKYDKDGQTHFVTELYVETIKFMSPKSKNDNILPNTSYDEDAYSFDHLEVIDVN